MNNLSKFISYQQVEEILKLYPRLVSLVDSLQVELQAAYIERVGEDDDDVIYALVVGNRQLDGMPRSPYSISDKTCNVAFIYKRAATSSNRAKIKKLSLEILGINMVIEKIDIAINSLDKYQQQLIERTYLKRNITTERPVSHSSAEKRRVKRERREALGVISKIMRITEEAYLNIISKIK